MVDSLKVKDIELALKQVEITYGEIENTHSDNYTSFKHLQKFHENWKFTSPYVSFQGGAWERAIKSAKRVMVPYLGRRLGRK